MRKIIILFLIINSIAFSFSLSPKRDVYNELKKADALYNGKKYDEALEIYSRLSEGKYYTEELEERISLVNYIKQEYSTFLQTEDKNEAEDLFNRGNALKKLGDLEKLPGKKIQSYEKALESYQRAIKLSEDLKIKQNYELLNKLLNKSKQEQEKQNQENDKQNQDKQNQNDDSEKQNSDNDKDNSSQTDENESNSKENKSDNQKNEESEGEDNKSKEQSQQDKSEGKDSKEASNKENKENDTKDGSSKAESEGEIDQNKLEEILYHLKKLEMSEKEDLKNNQKVLRGQSNERGKNW